MTQPVVPFLPEDSAPWSAKNAQAIADAQRWAAEHGVLPTAPDPSAGPYLGWDRPVVSREPNQSSVAEPPPFPGEDGSDEGGNYSSDGAVLANEADLFTHPRFQIGGGGPGNEVMGPHESYYKLYGPQGKEMFNETFSEAPKRYAEAVTKEADAEAGLGDARAKILGGLEQSQANQLAAIEQRRQEREAQEMQRQQQLDEATQRYSNDLADTGKFWRNPGSIFAAIGAVLMGLSGRHSTAKVLDDAVMADWNQRREIANQHLGELKSNLASYRQISGDATRGDQLALSESYRVAAMELDRVSAQFQGPIAKARAQKAIEDLTQKSNMLLMHTYQSSVFNEAKAKDPRVIKAEMAAGAAMPPGVGPTPFAPPGHPGNPLKAAASAAMAPNGGGGYAAPATSAPTVQASKDPLADVSKMSAETRARIEARAPGAVQVLESGRKMAEHRIWSISKGNKNLFNQNMEKYNAAEEEDVANIAKAAQPLAAKVNTYRRLGTDIKLIELTAQRLHSDPDTLMGVGGDAIFGAPIMAKIRDKYHALIESDPSNKTKWEKEESAVTDAVERFKQTYAGSKNAYTHENSGGNVTAGEEARMSEYIRLGWRAIKGFQDDQSNKAHAEYEAAINTAKTPTGSALYRIRVGTGSKPLDREKLAPGGRKPDYESPTKVSREETIDRAIKNAGGRKSGSK